MESLEGKHSHLKQHDYRTRINALMKCAEAADEQDLKLFALQNGGQCFGGKNDESTYRKHGPSAQCQGNCLSLRKVAILQETSNTNSITRNHAF